MSASDKLLSLFLAIFIVIASLSVAKSYTDARNIDALAKNMYFEARNSTIEDQIATALTVMNRGEPSVEVYKKNQFSWTTEYKEPADNKAYRKCRALAKTVYYNRESFETKGVCKHYAATSATRPSWSKTFTRHRVIGKHTYYCP